MAITNRDLPVGTRLVADYKQTRYVCTVEPGEEGEGVLYALGGRQEVQEPIGGGFSRHGRHGL